MSQQTAIELAGPRPACGARVRCLAALAAAHAIMRFLPVPRVGEVLHRLQHWARPATVEEAEAAVRLVRRVSMRAAAGRDAPVVALAASLVCLSRLRSAPWRVGIRTPPLETHAWIEAGGTPVGERIDVVSAYPIIIASS